MQDEKIRNMIVYMWWYLVAKADIAWSAAKGIYK